VYWKEEGKVKRKDPHERVYSHRDPEAQRERKSGVKRIRR
jgi:hypothetical protein